MESQTHSYPNFILLGLLALSSGAGSLRDVEVQVPRAVATGADASLLCLYDLEGDQLYTVKWYKGRQEFFRYVLKELPHTRVFALPGVNVDVVASGTERVVLRDVKKSLTGKYRCEVSTDAPHFHTEVKASYMHVIDKLRGQPDIRLEKGGYGVGDTLRANCTPPPSEPPANVTWYINGLKLILNNGLQEESSRTDNSSDGGGGVGGVGWSLLLDLSPSHFPGGKLHLRCVADLFAVSRVSRDLSIDEDRPRLASVLGSPGSAVSLSAHHALPLIVVSLLLCRLGLS